MSKDWTDDLTAMHACEDAVTWCRTQTDIVTAWATCTRGDWLLWYAARMVGHLPPESPERRRLAAAMSGCARLALPYTTDARVGACLDMLDRWAAGDSAVTLEDVRAASASASASAAFAADAAYAAADAAYAAADAAYAAYAAADAAGAYAADAAYADVVRGVYPEPPRRDHA